MTMDTKDYEGLYFFDNYGNIFSYPKKTRKGVRQIKPLLNKGNGYLFVDLCKDGNIKKFSVHRLIAISYFPNEEKSAYSLNVRDLNGRLLRQQTGILSSEFVFERSDLSPGIYFFQLIGKQNFTGRMVVE
jgi:hypothetical protein